MAQLQANGLQIEYETFGEASAPAILLVMGLGGQLILWPDSFCLGLARAGYFVIRYDNRDVGLSTKMEQAGKPRLMRAGLAYTFGLPVKTGYTLDDMANDAIGVLDALKIKRAHILGTSMGGMIAQIVAARFPQRVKSLVSVMSTSGNPQLPGPRWNIRMRLVKRPQSQDREVLIGHAMQTWRMISSPDYRPNEQELRAQVERNFDRANCPRGLARQTLAILGSASRLPLLAHITAPTLIIHGKSDPLVPVAAAYELAEHIPNARLEIIPGMGHDLPAPLVPLILRMILGHLRDTGRRHSKSKFRALERAQLSVPLQATA